MGKFRIGEVVATRGATKALTDVGEEHDSTFSAPFHYLGELDDEVGQEKDLAVISLPASPFRLQFCAMALEFGLLPSLTDC